MPIPQDILAIQRPKNTRVKKFGERYLVIKRTCKRINGKNIPVELGTIGEIINNQYVELRKEPRKKKTDIDIKDYGVHALFNNTCSQLFIDLNNVFDTDIAKRIYIIALLRAIDNDIRNRDISLSYETSFLSELFPSLALSENTISKLLTKIGMEYRYIHRFITKRAKFFEDKTQIIDGTLIDNNSTENSFSEYSRKAKTKGSKDLTLVYSFDIETKEPIAMKTYSGNMLDSTSITDFLSSFEIKKALLVLDKGFYTKDNIKDFNAIEELSYIVPLKNSSKIIKDSNILGSINKHLKGYEEMILYDKIKLEENKFLYGFKNLKDEYEQKISYIAFNDKNDKFDGEKYNEKNNTFGVIVFESNKDLSPLEVYLAYLKRWEIEMMFKMMKEVLDLDTVNVHSDYSVIATEFINYISVIMAQRVKQLLRTKKITTKNKKDIPISDAFSFKQTMRYLSKLKKVRFGDSDKWVTIKSLKYINELANILDI